LQQQSGPGFSQQHAERRKNTSEIIEMKESMATTDGRHG